MRSGFHSGWISAHGRSGGWLDAFLEHEFFDNSQHGNWLPIVVRIDVDYNQLLLRLTGRRTCPTCGRIYNIHSSHLASTKFAISTVLQLIIREDDREEVIRERLASL